MALKKLTAKIDNRHTSIEKTYTTQREPNLSPAARDYPSTPDKVSEWLSSLPPEVVGLIGIAKGSADESDYYEYLENKYL